MSSQEEEVVQQTTNGTSGTNGNSEEVMRRPPSERLRKKRQRSSTSESTNSADVVEDEEYTTDEENKRKRKRKNGEDEDQPRTARTRNPLIKVTIADFMRDTKSGTPTREAARKMKAREKQKRKKKRLKLRSQGIEVETSEEEYDEYDGDASQYYQQPYYEGVYGTSYENGSDQQVYHDPNYEVDPYGDSFRSVSAWNDSEQLDYDFSEASAFDTVGSSHHNNFDKTEQHVDEFADNFEGEDEEYNEDAQMTDEYLEDGENNVDQSYGDVNGAPQIMLDENGNVIFNAESVTVIEPAEQIDYSNYTRVNESEDKRRITSATYSNAKRTKKWEAEDDALLIKGIKQFGMDFTFVGRLFPRRSRREIKNRFKKLEKEKPEEIVSALNNREAIDLELFQKRSAEKDKIRGVNRKTAQQLQQEAQEAQAALDQQAAHEAQHAEADEWESANMETQYDEQGNPIEVYHEGHITEGGQEHYDYYAAGEATEGYEDPYTNFDPYAQIEPTDQPQDGGFEETGEEQAAEEEPEPEQEREVLNFTAGAYGE